MKAKYYIRSNEENDNGVILHRETGLVKKEINIEGDNSHYIEIDIFNDLVTLSICGNGIEGCGDTLVSASMSLKDLIEVSKQIATLTIEE